MEIRSFHSLSDVGPLRADLARLNRESRRPSPFATLEFLETYLAHDEFFPEQVGLEVWFLVAVEDGRPVGYLPLRRVHQDVAGLRVPKLEFLATHDVARPDLVCRPQDEARCAAAFWRHLLARKAQWSMLELKQVEPGSPLFPLPEGLDLHAHYVRPFECLPVSVIPIRWPDVPGYFAAMDRKFRANTRRQIRNLLASGQVEFLQSGEASARPALLDLYLDVERRSWKARVLGTIGRDPRRVRFFRALAEPGQPLRLCLGLVVRDGVPVAGYLAGHFERQLFGLQVAFDEQLARLSPGSLLFAMMMKQAVDLGCRCLDLMSGFTYYKTHWLGETVDCRTVQVFRVGSALFYRALLGELRRTLEARLAPAAGVEAGNALKHQVEAAEGEGAGDGQEVAADRRFYEPWLAGLRAQPVRVYSAADLATTLGLGAAREAAGPEAQRAS